MIEDFQSGLTGKEFRECLLVLRWTERTVASALGLSHSRVNRIANGIGRFSIEESKWIRRLANFHRETPPPQAASKRLWDKVISGVTS